MSPTSRHAMACSVRPPAPCPHWSLAKLLSHTSSMKGWQSKHVAKALTHGPPGKWPKKNLQQGYLSSAEHNIYRWIHLYIRRRACRTYSSRRRAFMTYCCGGMGVTQKAGPLGTCMQRYPYQICTLGGAPHQVGVSSGHVNGPDGAMQSVTSMFTPFSLFQHVARMVRLMWHLPARTTSSSVTHR